MSLSRPLTRPLTRALSRPLTGGIGLDSDALAYIAAVRAAGATVNATQTSAINAFYTTAKSDGYYTSLKRLYFPIWGVAAANAIDMIGRTSGTFNGTVTHAAGYVQGDRSTGWFDYGVSPATLGLTTSSASILGLRYALGVSDTNYEATAGSWSGTTTSFGLLERSTNCIFDVGDEALRLTVASPAAGILIGSQDATGRRIVLRTSSGFSTLGSSTPTPAGTIPSVNISAMVRNAATPLFYADQQIGAHGVAMGLSSATLETLSLALQDLWETCTSLSLP